ncbi:MAG TPA: NAD(P)-dependent oxidoreductase [Actinomycetota bacterium]|jgi:3-hydroxyisobutyrate dehydrogenase/2-hydroxy-3-oxopropionate reductase
MTRVAFLGLGAMGRPMAGRLLDAGHDLRVWNRSPGRDEALVAAGARRAATPAEAVEDAEVAITMLSDPPALEQVLFGPGGLGEAIGSDATLIEMSTVGPEAIREAATRLAPVPVLDAPVLGSVPHAEAGTMTIVAGGDATVFARHVELLQVLGVPLHVGPSGAGATLKLANNAAVMSALIGLGEVLALTDRAGIDPEVVLDAMGRGPLGSLIERWRDKITGAVRRVDFRLALARKDVGLAIDAAAGAGLRLAVPEGAIGRLDEAIAAGRADDDNSAVIEVVRA